MGVLARTKVMDILRRFANYARDAAAGAPLFSASFAFAVPDSINRRSCVMGCKLFCAVRRCRNNPLNRGHIRHRARARATPHNGYIGMAARPAGQAIASTFLALSTAPFFEMVLEIQTRQPAQEEARTRSVILQLGLENVTCLKNMAKR